MAPSRASVPRETVIANPAFVVDERLGVEVIGVENDLKMTVYAYFWE